MYASTQFRNAFAKNHAKIVWLVSLQARNRVTNSKENLNLTNGTEDMVVTLPGGEIRSYVGAGGLMSVPGFRFETGYNYNSNKLELAVLRPEVKAIIQQHDTFNGRVQIHLGVYDDNGVLQIAQFFEGFADEVEIMTDTDNSAKAVITIYTSMRNGTRVLWNEKRSHEAQKRRDENDNMRQYSVASGDTNVHWGGKGGTRHKVGGFTAGESLAKGVYPLFTNR